jgi:branched-subunit amino acid ABC-type transport system permease component
MLTATMITVQQGLNMVSDGAILFLLAIGLGVIFGLMNVINFAHGAMIMVGAYSAAVATQEALSPWLAIVAGAVVGAAIGLAVETLIIRRLYDRPWDTILATIGLGLVMVAGVSIIIGRESEFVAPPVTGRIDLGFATYSAYRTVLVGFALVLFVALLLVRMYTKVGLIARAVMANESLSSSLGIDTGAVRRWTFMFGFGLAGLAGALVAPLAAVHPNMGDNYLVPAFMAVMVAYSSVGGLAAASLLFGATASWVTFVSNTLVGSVVIIVLAAAILRIFPNGFQALSLPRWLRRARKPAAAVAGR